MEKLNKRDMKQELCTKTFRKGTEEQKYKDREMKGVK